MKSTGFFLSVLIFACACNGHAPESFYPGDDSGFSSVGHDMIVLGRRLQDPYSLDNMTKAAESLYSTKGVRLDFQPTDIYVRFLPESEEEYNSLVEAGLDLMDHPLDYQIVKEGDYYHDPQVQQGRITWQYAVVPYGKDIPQEVRHEILDNCYIPENDATKAGWVDWAAVEREAFRLTGNASLLEPETRGGASRPNGRITIADSEFNEGKPFGVAGVKIVCNSFVKFSSTYTDRDGYYSISRKYSSKVRYRMVFKNKLGFAQGFNFIIVSASVSSLGKASPEGLDAEITPSSDKKQFIRCAVNNAAYEYFSRCGEDDMDIPSPPKGLRFWVFPSLGSSSPVMLKHGAFLDNDLVTKYLGDFVAPLKVFLPDIILGLDGKTSYPSIYSETCHELAHASHFTRAGKGYWTKYLTCLLKSYVLSGGTAFGDGTEDDAGICAIAEMWGYFIQNMMYYERYGKLLNEGYGYWFKPQIFQYLYDRGVSRKEIISAMTDDVDGLAALREKLCSLYPEKKDIITQVFNRYVTE